MKRYAADDELRLSLQRDVRDWAESGLLSQCRASELHATLNTSLRTTGVALRLVLAAFTVLASAAAVALFFVTADIRNIQVVGMLAGVFGFACFAAADVLVVRFRLYRHGLEEALVSMAVVLFGFSANLLSDSMLGTSGNEALSLAACALVSAAAYARFGFRYAVVASLMFAAFIPLTLRGLSLPSAHLAAALVCICGYAVAAVMRHSANADVVRQDARVLAAAAFALGYLSLNLHANLAFTFDLDEVPAWFRWSTYVLIWILPAFGVWRGVRERNRALMNVAIAAALVSIITNKSYLGWPRQTWDPMLFGLFLIAVAIAIRHWLASGPGGERYGFTALRLSHKEGEALQSASMAPAARSPLRPAPAPTTELGGGSFGGGGAGGGF